MIVDGPLVAKSGTNKVEDLSSVSFVSLRQKKTRDSRRDDKKAFEAAERSSPLSARPSTAAQKDVKRD